ncbi:MAG: hypothetical protein L3J73_00715 [Thermoplasmata archaeon]|nr:hypothetical protein [Thermoplasmata archaeon]
MEAPSADLEIEAALLDELAAAIDRAPRPVREIAAGIALSIALGKQRPAVACGGCATPLEFRGIPARTDARLRTPFELVLSDDAPVRS